MVFKRLVNLDFRGAKGLFLFGPRQTGKSFWLKKKFPKVLYYDLLKSDLFTQFSRSPHGFREEVLAGKKSKSIIIDEIQKIPALLNEVHYLMERHGIKFILTGSSSRKLKGQGVNLLGGRALYRRLFPLVSQEIPQFQLQRILNYGSLPAVYPSRAAKSILNSYVHTYLKEEVWAEGLVRNLSPFSRFLELAGKTNAGLINYSNLASDIGLSSHTIKEYYFILEDTFMGHLLPPYKKTIKRKSVSMHKFYFFDIGVLNALTNNWGIGEGSREFGHYFEHFIFNELKAYLEYTGDDRKICFWRSKNHQEVDFVVGDNLAIEVKASHEVKPRDLKGLQAFCEEKPFRHKIVVSFDKRPRLVQNQFLVLPYRDFLKKLWNKKFV